MSATPHRRDRAADGAAGDPGPTGGSVPAGGAAADLPAVVRVRPVRLRRVCAVLAVAVVVAFAVVAVLLGGDPVGAPSGVGDQIAMFCLGLLVAGGVLLVGRPSLEADERGLRVRNILASHDVPWTVVTAVSFRDGFPWASLDLADDETLALLAVQASDGERAVAAVRALRALHARHSGAGSEQESPG